VSVERGDKISQYNKKEEVEWNWGERQLGRKTDAL